MNVTQTDESVTIVLSNEEADSLEFITERFLDNYDLEDEHSVNATELYSELSGYESSGIFDIEF